MSVAILEAKKAEFKVRPRPQLGLGWTMIDQAEEKLVLDVLRRKEPFRYYGVDLKTPPPMVANLEKEFAAKWGTKFALAVTSGTAALEVALGALGVGPGDEVIVPAWSWISCFTAIVRLGALPVLADIDESFCLAPGEIKRLANQNTKAVLIVHYQGVSADLDKLIPEARAAGIKVLEDCAEAISATYHGKPVGSMGDIATFSFQFAKIMTSGEGGMVITNDPILYERSVRMHDIGQVRGFHTQYIKPQVPAFSGSQFRMTELQGAMALGQLRKVDRIRNRCRELQERIVAQISDLKSVSLRRIPDPTGDTGFEVYLSLPSKEQADEFRNKLDALNVNCNKMTGTYCHYAREYCITGHAHHPAASPFAKFKEWPAKGYRQQDFPRTESIIHRFVALPIGMMYADEDADYVAAAVRHVHGQMFGA